MMSFYLLNSSCMEAAAFLPSPIARITVAAPLTASPPANTPLRVVCIVTSSAIKHLCLLASKPAVVLKINGFGEVPRDMISHATNNQTVNFRITGIPGDFVMS